MYSNADRRLDRIILSGLTLMLAALPLAALGAGFGAGYATASPASGAPPIVLISLTAAGVALTLGATLCLGGMLWGAWKSL